MSAVPGILQMLPKPLGFGKFNKMQPLSVLQRKKLIATLCELQVKMQCWRLEIWDSGLGIQDLGIRAAWSLVRHQDRELVAAAC